MQRTQIFPIFKRYCRMVQKNEENLGNILDRVDIELEELNSNLDIDGTSVPDIHNMSLEDSFD